MMQQGLQMLEWLHEHDLLWIIWLLIGIAIIATIIDKWIAKSKKNRDSKIVEEETEEETENKI